MHERWPAGASLTTPGALGPAGAGEPVAAGRASGTPPGPRGRRAVRRGPREAGVPASGGPSERRSLRLASLGH
eukprot:4634202-Pyramimonas_sp.AAC.1